MAAYIVTPSAAEWPVIEKFLRQCHQGAIVISPDAQAALEEKGIPVGDLSYIEYDYGGEPDKMIDVVEKGVINYHLAVTAMRESLNLENQT